MSNKKPIKRTTASLYPKGSRFQLKNDAGEVIASTEDEQESYRYQSNGQLLVFLSYREGADQFPSKQELIRIFTSKEALDESGLLSKTPEENIPSTKEEEEETPLLSETGAYIGKVQAKKQVFPSTLDPGKLNLILSFNNGIVFTYIDGVAQAQLGEEKLAIKGNYIVSSPKGTANISFNPSSGEVWYDFEPRD